MSEDEGLDFNIVEAGMHDLEMLAPLFDRYRMFYKQPSDLVLARRFLRARIEHRNSVIFLAVELEEDGEKALGFTLLYPSYNSVMATPIWILNDLYIDESARRHGIAQALIARGKALAEETGARVMSLSTAKDNAPSRKLYEALGFKLDETYCTYILEFNSK